MLSAKLRTTVKDRGANAILRQIESIGQGSSVTAGYHFPEARKLPMFRGKVDGKTPIGTYAAIQEYGGGTTPARPTLGPTVNKQADTFAKQTATGMRKLYTSRGVVSVHSILKQQGERIRKWIRKAIRDTHEPPNSPEYLAWKRKNRRSTSPLTSSKSMYNAVSYRVNMSPIRMRTLSREMQKIERELRRAE